MMDPDKYASATIVSRRDPAPDLWIIRIHTESELPYRPGQYVTLGLQSNGRSSSGPYSICSSPLEDEIELFIERVPDGELSDPLFALGVGGEIDCSPAYQGTVSPRGTARRRAASLRRDGHRDRAIRQPAADARVASAGPGNGALCRSITLQGAARSAELGYADELVALAEEFSWFTYVPTVSRPWEDPGVARRVGTG